MTLMREPRMVENACHSMVVERRLHPGGRHAGDRRLNEAIWKPIMGRSSKLPAPLHKKSIGSEPGGMGGE
jgi:hypothetical protein